MVIADIVATTIIAVVVVMVAAVVAVINFSRKIRIAWRYLIRFVSQILILR